MGFLERGQLSPTPPARGFGECYKLPPVESLENFYFGVFWVLRNHFRVLIASVALVAVIMAQVVYPVGR